MNEQDRLDILSRDRKKRHFAGEFMMGVKGTGKKGKRDRLDRLLETFKAEDKARSKEPRFSW